MTQSTPVNKVPLTNAGLISVIVVDNGPTLNQHWVNVGHSRRQWTNIKPALG